MKTNHFLYILLITLVAFGSCKRLNRTKKLKGSLVQLDTAIAFRENFINVPNNQFHIPQALMFEAIEFESLFSMNGVDEIRFYPAIDTHNDLAPDSLTLIMVPVNSASNTDILTGNLFEYAQDCPPTCSGPSAAVVAPTEEELKLNIPLSWCVSEATIQNLLSEAASVVGENNVYGIRMYWFTNDQGIMDFKLCATTNNGQSITDIPNVETKGVTQICMDGDGCCDRKSRLYRKPR